MPVEIEAEVLQRPVIEEYCIVLVRVKKADISKLALGQKVKITEVI